MAKRNNEVIRLGKDDYEQKSFKTAPGGTYRIKFTNKSKLKPAKSGGGVTLEAHGTITKGEHKGTTFIDNIGSSVTWKIAQTLAALGKKKKEITMEQLLKMLISSDEIRAILKVTKYNNADRNEVVQYLPLTNGSEHDEDHEDEDEDEDDSDEDDDEDDDEGDDADEDEDDDDEGDDDEDEDEEDEDADEDDDDEEEEPVKDKGRKRSAAKKAAGKKTAAKKTAAKRSKKK
jgi:hypothetical protein